MGPEWLLHAVLIVAGILAGIGALRLLATGERGQALRIGVASLTLLLLAIALGRTEMTGGSDGAREKPSLLVPADAGPSPAAKGPETNASTSLLLGDVTLRVAPSEQYVFSVGGKRFLALDMRNGGMMATCRLGDPRDGPVVRIRRNRMESFGIAALRQPDRHTLLVRDRRDEEVLRIRYAAPREIQVTGLFAAAPEPVSISPKGGIRWSGGGVPPGTSIDLAHYGKGRIDFAPSGLIEVVP